MQTKFFLFGRASVENVRNIIGILNEFKNQSRLFKNATKSKIIVLSKLPMTFRHLISSDVGMSSSTFFGKYLGISIYPNKLRKGDYKDMLNKTVDKIKG